VTGSGHRARRLRLPAVPASLDAVHDLVEQLWSGQAGVALAERTRFETAVAEVAGNIIEHAVPVAGAGQVWLTFTADAGPDGVRGEFTDDGRPVEVELDGVQMPGADAEDGRGLALTRLLCDELRYERVAGTNRWTLVCRRDGVTGP